MEFISPLNVRTHRRIALYLVVLSLITTSFLVPSVIAQVTPGTDVHFDRTCSGLHAGIRAEFAKNNMQPPFVMVSFVLLNDGEAIAGTSPGSWKLVIDGKELSDSTMIFGNGPGPADGWRTLNPGGTAEFGKALEVVRFFPEPHEYKISWRGTGFQSPTITVKVPASPN